MEVPYGGCVGLVYYACTSQSCLYKSSYKNPHVWLYQDIALICSELMMKPVPAHLTLLGVLAIEGTCNI